MKKINKSIDLSDLPVQVFDHKNVNEFPPPQSRGKPLQSEKKKTAGKPAEKTSRKEGLNESSNNNNAFTAMRSDKKSK